MKQTVFALLLAAASAPSFAAYGLYVDHQHDYLTPLSVPGANVTNNAWVNLSAFTDANGVPGISGTGGYPGMTPWSGKASNTDTSFGSVGGSLGGATLGKVSNSPAGGGAYAASSSLYFGGFSSTPNTDGGKVRVTDATPIADLANVVFQIGIGEAMTWGFYNDVLPTLTYTTAGGSFTLAASFTQLLEQYDNGVVSMPTGDETIWINQYALQWDLSGVAGDITSFSIDFNGVQHAQVYGLTLTQSDVFNQAVAVPVPEPETYALMLAGLAGMGFVARRRRASDNA